MKEYFPKGMKKYIIKQLKNEGLNNEDAEIHFQYRLDQTNSLRTLTLLNCWTISKHVSYALWKIYLGDPKSGVAIKTTVSRLENAIRKGRDPYDEDIYMSKVKYTDLIDKLDITIRNLEENLSESSE